MVKSKHARKKEYLIYNIHNVPVRHVSRYKINRSCRTMGMLLGPRVILYPQAGLACYHFCADVAALDWPHSLTQKTTSNHALPHQPIKWSMQEIVHEYIISRSLSSIINIPSEYYYNIYFNNNNIQLLDEYPHKFTALTLPQTILFKG